MEHLKLVLNTIDQNPIDQQRAFSRPSEAP